MSQGFGRVALVSSGSRGIGAATVRRLAADGWDISFCHHHDDQAAVETEKAASELGARVLAVQADLTAIAEVSAWVRRAAEDLGPVHAVVSCAGITRDQPLALLTDADWRAVTDTSLEGVFHLCRAVLPAMMECQSGRIVAVSSVSGVYGHTTADAARAGIAGFIRALASQTRRYGIRANAVTPAAHIGRADTTSIWPEGTTVPLIEAIALRRFASAGEAADRVAFLLSDAAADITGTVVEVPGGISLTPARCRSGRTVSGPSASTGAPPTCPRVHSTCPITAGSTATMDSAGSHASLSRNSSTSLASAARANAATVISPIAAASPGPSRLISTATLCAPPIRKVKIIFPPNGPWSHHPTTASSARRTLFDDPPACLTGSVRMPKIALLSRVRAKEGRGEDLIAAFRPLFEAVEQEPGTLLYVLHRSSDDRDLFWVCELYADDDAFAAHRTSDAMAAATPALAALIAEAEFMTGEPLSTKGVPA